MKTMVFCTQCGKQTKNERFCENCGTEIEQSSTMVPSLSKETNKENLEVLGINDVKRPPRKENVDCCN